MKISINKEHRHIVLSYNEIRKLWKVPFEGDLMMSKDIFGEMDFHIYQFERGVTNWNIEYSREEIESKLKLLPKEIIIDFDYVAFGKYKARIETNKENLLILKDYSDKLKQGFFSKLFNLNLDVNYLNFKDYIKLIDRK